MRRLILAAALLSLAAGPAAADLILSEVFYDHSGTDSGFEWVEISNTGTSGTIDLTGYILAWGGTDYSYGQHVISGMIGDCSTFLVGGPTSDAENGAPFGFSDPVDFEPDLQNAGTTADAVALFAPGSDPLVDTPIDAVIYGDANVNGLIDETGLPGAVDVADAPSGSSIIRTSLAGAWAVSAAPAPYEHEFTYDCGGVVGNEDSTWGALKALFR